MKYCIWITGLPGSGKSTIAEILEGNLARQSGGIFTLHSDGIRKFITPEPEYSVRERDIVYSALAYMAKLLVDTGCKNVIIDATGNRKKYRDNARKLIPEFAEVYVKCPVEICRKREAERNSNDTESDLYIKARSGRLKGKLPGVDTPYEEPADPEVTVHSDVLTPTESADKITDYIRSRWSGR